MVEYYLQVMRGEPLHALVSLHHLPVLAGRHEECRLRITSRSVSRRHCLFYEQDDQLIVRDLDSGNGVLVNGGRVVRQQQLAHGDMVTIGPVQFRVIRSAPTNAAPDSGSESDVIALLDDTVAPGSSQASTDIQVPPKPPGEPR